MPNGVCCSLAEEKEIESYSNPHRNAFNKKKSEIPLNFLNASINNNCSGRGAFPSNCAATIPLRADETIYVNRKSEWISSEWNQHITLAAISTCQQALVQFALRLATTISDWPPKLHRKIDETHVHNWMECGI